MRGIVIVSLCLLLLLAACIGGVWYITDSAARVAASFPALSRAVADQDWTRAQTFYQQSHACFEQVSQYWEVMINHDDMRDVEVAFVDLEVAIGQQDQREAEKELADLAYFLQHVPNTERIDLGNIF